MKRILLILCAVLSFATATAAGRVHRVASCNIRVALDEDEKSGHGWSSRRAACIRAMKRLGADIYCLQEVIARQARDLRDEFSGYVVLGYEGPEMDRQSDEGYHGIAKNLILFSRSRYELCGAGCYWLSDTPLTGGSVAWGTARARHVNWVRLRDRRSGFEFRVASIHLDHISPAARDAQTDCIISEADQYPASFAQVLVGDFNSRPDEGPAQRLSRASWTDIYRRLHADDDTAGTYHGFQGEDFVPKGRPGRIDFIFLRGEGLEATDARIDRTTVHGRYPSDHYFLIAELAER